MAGVGVLDDPGLWYPGSESILTQQLRREDIVGQKIAEIRQVVSINPGDLDFVDNLLVLENGHAFRLPYDRSEPICQVEVPHDAVLFDRDEATPMKSSPIADILCPLDDEFVNPESTFIRLESGLWICQVVGFPSGACGIGLFAGAECPWRYGDEVGGQLDSYFRDL